MNPTPEQTASSPTASPVSGSGIFSLVLGILAVCLSFLLLGGILGLIGSVFAIVCLRRKRCRTAMAWWGFSLSLLGVLASLGFGVLYYQVFRHVRDAMESTGKETALTEWEGATAPDFTFTTLDGKKTTLSEFKGKRIVLDFWATWCPPCRKEIPHFIRLVNDTPREDLVAVGISDEAEKVLQPFVKKNGMNYLVARVDKLPPPYDSIQSIPTTVFIDRHGVIQKVLIGYHDFDTLKSYALQKDSDGTPRPQSAAASVLKESVQPLLEAALTQTNAIGEKGEPTFPQRVLAFNRRTLTEAYKQVGMRDPKWDDLVVEYLDNYARGFTEPRKAPSAENLRTTGKQIAGLGCKDPLFLFCYSIAQYSCNDKAGAEETLSPAVDGLLKSKYPAVRQRFGATRMAYLLRNQGFKKQAEYEAWRTQTISLMVKSLQDGSYQDGEQRIFIAQFELEWEDLFSDKREEVYQAIKAAKGIDPWILKIVEGEYWIAQAWKARGHGWANTVTDDGWKGFYAGLAKARTSFTSAWKMHPDYPEGAANMIRITMGEGDRQKEPPRVWFGRAIEAQADYLPAYRHYEYQLLPRWGGSHEAMLNFGFECLATKRFDTDIPYQYYVMVYKVVNDLDSPGTALWDDPAIFTNLQEMCEGYIKSDNAPGRKPAYQSEYASICWRTGHYDIARRILDELGDKFEGYAFMRDFSTPFDTACTEIYALTSPFADNLKAARTLAASNFHAKAINYYQDIAHRANGDSNVIAYASQKIEALRMTMKASQGDWVPLAISKDLTGWSVRAGVWKVENDGAVLGESTQAGLLLVCNQLFGPNIEIKGELEFVQAPYKFKFNGGVVVGATDEKPNDFYSCLLYQAEREASVGAPSFRSSDRVTKPASVEAKNSVLMRIRDNRLTVIVNGSSVFDEAAMEGYHADKQQRVGIGGYYWYPGAVLRFRNLQIRSLKDGPG